MPVEIFEHFNIWALVVPSLITTFIVSALTTLFDAYFSTGSHKKACVAVVSVLVTILSSSFSQNSLEEYQRLLLNIFLTMAFAVLFYSYLGGWIVSWFFSLLKDKLSGGKAL